MCKVADVAMELVNKSIARAVQTNDKRYYMNFVKLHKLLYLGQCCMRARYRDDLFEEEVRAYDCGPYIEEIRFVTVRFGFSQIEKPFNSDEYAHPSIRRNLVLNWILDTFGTRDADDLIRYTKNTLPFKSVRSQIQIEAKHYPIISKSSMERAFNEAASSDQDNSAIIASLSSLSLAWS